RQLSEIATSQASHLQAAQDQERKEKELLKNAVADLQMQEDSKLVIGQLHQHILTLQKRETGALAQSAELKSKCLRLEKMVILLEGESSALSKMIFELRLKTRNRIQGLQKSLTDFRLRFCGTVLFEKHERVCLSAGKLAALNAELEKQIQTLTLKTIELEAGLDSHKTKALLYDELLATIEGTGSNAQKRISAWQKKISDSQNIQLKLQREAQREREKYKLLKETSDSNGKRIEQLEDLIVNLQQDFDVQALEWEAQQSLYEKTISYFEEERDRLYLTTNAVEMKELLPDRTLPIGEQLEIALRMLVDRSRQAKIAHIKIGQLEDKQREMVQSLQTATHNLELSQLELNKTRLELEEKKEPVEKQADAASVLTDKSRIREANALRFAHETTMSLQRQLNQKNELVEKYRDKLKTVRGEMALKAAEKDSFIEELNRKLDELTKREVMRAQSAPEEEAPRESEIQMELGLVEELRQVVAVKEVAVTQLQAEMELLQKSFAGEKEALQGELLALQTSLSEQAQSVANLEEQRAALESELESANEILARPAVKDLSDVVSRLQGEVEGKDQKIGALKKSIQTLKSQLLSVSKELAESKMNENLGMPNAEEILLQQKMATRIAQLETRNKRMAESFDKTKLELQQLEQDMQRVSDELVLKNTEIARLTAQNQSLKSVVEKSASSSNLEQLVKSFQTDHPLDPSLKRNSSWEAEKAHQKRIEALRDKLKCKTAEYEALTNNHSMVKEVLARSERDRLRLQTKVQKLSSETPQLTTQYTDQIAALQGKVAELQTALGNASRKTKTLAGAATASSGASEKRELEFLDKRDLVGKPKAELVSLIERLAQEFEKHESVPKSKYSTLLAQSQQLKKDLQAAAESEKSARDNTASVHRLDEENQKLRKMLRKDTDKVKQIAEKNNELSIANESLLKEIVGLRKLVSGISDQSLVADQTAIVEDLRRTIAEKETLIQELMSPDANEASRLAAENRRLKRDLEMFQLRVAKLSNEHRTPDAAPRALQEENERLKTKLKMLGEEVEDLRFNYKDALKRSILNTAS
ncbi:hypothetical protein HDU91_007459, partial [Kappamyces sp. JEL0680]